MYGAILVTGIPIGFRDIDELTQRRTWDNGKNR